MLTDSQLRFINTITQLLLSLLTLATFVWAVWQGYLFITNEQQGLESGVQSILTIIGILVLVCTYILASAIRYGARAIAQGYHLKRKQELYETFVLHIHTLLAEVNEGSKAKLQQEIDNLKPYIALQAGQPVIKAMNSLMIEINAENPDILKINSLLEKLVLAMRYDLGYPKYYTLQREMRNMFTPLK